MSSEQLSNEQLEEIAGNITKKALENLFPEESIDNLWETVQDSSSSDFIVVMKKIVEEITSISFNLWVRYKNPLLPRKYECSICRNFLRCLVDDTRTTIPRFRGETFCDDCHIKLKNGEKITSSKSKQEITLKCIEYRSLTDRRRGFNGFMRRKHIENLDNFLEKAKESREGDLDLEKSVWNIINVIPKIEDGIRTITPDTLVEHNRCSGLVGKKLSL